MGKAESGLPKIAGRRIQQQSLPVQTGRCGATALGYEWDALNRRWQQRYTPEITSAGGTFHQQESPGIQFTVLDGQRITSADTPATTAFCTEGLQAVYLPTGIETDNWIHTDHLGSVAVMTDITADWTTVRDYFPYGEERVSQTQGSAATNRFDYGNKERDETGLSYFEARYMSTATGRFTSLDPVFLAAGSAEWLRDPQAQNSYTYARSNPLTLIDPTGLWNARTGEVEEGDTLGAITNTINQLYDTNYDYKQIAASNSIDDPNSISVGQIIKPNAFTPDVSVDLMEKMEQNASNPFIQNPLYFRNKVKTGGDWDLKNKEGLYCTNSSCGGEEHDFVFLGKTIEYDAPGNIHYGYVGSKTWYGTPKFLHRKAAAAQNRDNGTNNGDDLRDTRAISFGIYLFNRR